MAGVDELQARFRAQASTAAARAPFLASLCEAIAERPDVAALLGAAPETQQSPVLLLAAIHASVLAEPDAELAAWFPTVSDAPRVGNVGPALERFATERADELRRTVATRVTQTNEIGRCGLLVPALGLIDAEVGPLALVDVGASAGLNLRLTRYSYRYEPGGSVGDPASPVHLGVGTRGSVPVPAELPRVTARIGLDRQPVDLDDPADVAWLRACVWPDQRDRFERLDAALAIAVSDRVDVRQGDAVTDLASAVAAVAATAHPVVLNTWVLSYLTPAERTAYLAQLDLIGAEHDVSWVFAESPTQTPELPHGVDVVGRETTSLGLVRWRDGSRHVEHLGVAHPHGYWLHWHRVSGR